MKKKSQPRKFPSIKIDGRVTKNWEPICNKVVNNYKERKPIAIECYIGVDLEEIMNSLNQYIDVLDTRTLFKSTSQIEDITAPDVTDDETFGMMTRLELVDFFDKQQLEAAKANLVEKNRRIAVIGPGAFLVLPHADLKIYADLARWEIQLRMRKNQIKGLGVVNMNEPFNIQYKRGFFVDWRVCDRHKMRWFLQCDYLLDTHKTGHPKLVEMSIIKKALKQLAHQPFSFVPYFDPGPWGGHWLERVFDLETENVPNYAWCMNCVPEENSLLFEIDNEVIEIPGIDLVFFESRNLLGDVVEARFGKEFPIRFDFLDTMDGGNLSLQVHPDTTYIQENFGMHYTQDESYYLIDAKEDASVYLGFRENANVDEMIDRLLYVRDDGNSFDVEQYVNKFPAKKHDHFLIPAGTIHCSGKNSMVLEISSTPYIFTFKMWDWGRLGIDGKPRPINIEHANNVIERSRDTSFAEQELINVIKKVDDGPGWIEEHTGLHKREFIETRRHWFSQPVMHESNGSVNVLMLVEGQEAIIESPDNHFEPYIIHFAEAIVIPASIKRFLISPFGDSKGEELVTIKAYVRH
jgi:mannose-6-phosphate isomerase class I